MDVRLRNSVGQVHGRKSLITLHYTWLRERTGGDGRERGRVLPSGSSALYHLLTLCVTGCADDVVSLQLRVLVNQWGFSGYLYGPHME